jgi:hypothetical protein
LDVQFTLRCTRDAGGLWEYPVWLAKRVQAVKFALDLVDSPELTGQALKLAEMRQRVGEGWQYVHGIYGAHDPGIGSMSEGQLMEMHDMITSKDRSNRRAFNDYARSMGVDPRLGYSTSGG